MKLHFVFGARRNGNQKFYNTIVEQHNAQEHNVQQLIVKHRVRKFQIEYWMPKKNVTK